MTWRNTTREPAVDLYFHLYLNAFANSQSSFVRGVGDAWVDWLQRHPNGWGYITVTAIRIGGTDVTPRMQFVHPDDDNLDDRTVFRLPLEKPLRPGATMEVEIEFAARLPKVFARAGYAGPFALVAQWFPKIGVYQDGAWNCHQYHSTTEFFADFGVYDVTLTVPRDGVVGATGVLREQHDNGDGTKTLHFVAEDVHDFAWTIDPRFHTVEDTVGGHARAAARAAEPPRVKPRATSTAARAALQHYDEWIGPYPYPQLTIVDPGPGGSRAGGMEYPTLITVGTTWWMPRGLRLPEFGHGARVRPSVLVRHGRQQRVRGSLARRGRQLVRRRHASWTTPSGPASYVDRAGACISTASRCSGCATSVGAARSDDCGTRGSSSTVPATAPSRTARRRWCSTPSIATLGDERLRAALAVYFDRWRFRHPRGGDFVASVEQSVGEDLTWYFDQVVSEYRPARLRRHAGER